MEYKQPVDLLAQERANPPETTDEALKRLAHLLRTYEWVIPDHRWDFQKVCEPADPLAYQEWNNGKPFREWSPEARPEEYYAECGTVGCALGVAYTVWGQSLAMEFFDTKPTNKVSQIFNAGYGGNGAWWERTGALVTPEHVAQRIDNYLAGKPLFKHET